MRTKNVLIAFFVLVVIIAGVLVIKNRAKIAKNLNPAPTPSIQQRLEDKFRGLTIPLDEEKVELKDVSGKGGVGIVTNSEILADLPDLSPGQNYQVWVENSSGKKILLGNLKQAKGGWILLYDFSKLPDYKKIVITDGKTPILEGSF